MQALMLDVVFASIRGSGMQKVNMLDIGAATGYLTYASSSLIAGEIGLSDSKVTGIDLSQEAIRKAQSLHSRFNPKIKTAFVLDDFFHHLEIFNKYNLIVSGCGLSQADVVGSILSKVETDDQLVLIAPVFTSSKEQQLRIHCPKSKTDGIM